MKSLIFGLILFVFVEKIVWAQRVIENKEILQQQKRILDLLQHVYQPNIIPEISEVAESYSIEENINNYRVPSAVAYFLKLYNSGLLPRDGVFSILNEKQRREAIALFETLYFAKDFETLYKTACWARVNVNPGQFVYALMAVVSHREDLKDITFPPMYEINPYFFVDADVMQKATEMFVNRGQSNEDIIVSTDETDYLYGSTRKVFPNVDYQQPENRIQYFTEDVSLNTYNNYYHLNNPFWMNITEGKRGELFWYYHQQLLARYLQERFSNELPNFEPFRIDAIIEDGYNPRLRYPNGKYFSSRPNNIKLDHSYGYDVKLVEDFERRIRDAIDLGYVFGENGEQISIDDKRGIDLLGHLIQSTVKSTNRKYYGNLYQITMQLLGRITDPRRSQHIPPGVLEHFETALRDPLHYRILATIIQLFSRYKSHLPHYLKDDLEFPGVKIDAVEIGRLNTYFENFDFDVSNGIVNNKLDDEPSIKVRHYRLNHSPFSYFINVTAEKPITGMVRAFIGLSRNADGRPLDINERRKYMVQIDNFPLEFQAGKNVIERKSDEITITRKTYPGMQQLYREVNDALQGKGQFIVNDNQVCGYPEHLLLPKGKVQGMPYSFFIVISQYNPKEFENAKYGCGNGRGLFFEDQHPMGYPFDRVIEEQEFNVPNFYEKEVLVFHTNVQE